MANSSCFLSQLHPFSLNDTFPDVQVYTGPPNLLFKWRHFGKFSGTFQDKAPTEVFRQLTDKSKNWHGLSVSKCEPCLSHSNVTMSTWPDFFLWQNGKKHKGSGELASVWQSNQKNTMKFSNQNCEIAQFFLNNTCWVLAESLLCTISLQILECKRGKSSNRPEPLRKCWTLLECAWQRWTKSWKWQLVSSWICNWQAEGIFQLSDVVPGFVIAKNLADSLVLDRAPTWGKLGCVL